MIDTDAIRRAHGLIGPANQVLWAALVRDFGQDEVLDECEAIWMDLGQPVTSVEVRRAIEKRRAPRADDDGDDDQVETTSPPTSPSPEPPSPPPVLPEVSAAPPDVDLVESAGAPLAEPVTVDPPIEIKPAWTSADEKRYAAAAAATEKPKRPPRPPKPAVARPRRPPAKPAPAAPMPRPKRTRTPRARPRSLAQLIRLATSAFRAFATRLRGL